ncbi:hypothetical protein GUJ93_ZPchr0010g7519 [Zizania palustris]|uniref:Uncharacterized protein n=1 Tax=Zizania palustris TaxID=103762 RepID=A0A8J5TDQ7_ZIZPA|nr:hypothetical protein GUJ93_ZPchr0010g7519 [Zizania palustris]
MLRSLSTKRTARKAWEAIKTHSDPWRQPFEMEVIKKLRNVVLDHLPQVAIAIETLLNVNELSIKEVTR